MNRKNIILLVASAFVFCGCNNNVPQNTNEDFVDNTDILGPVDDGSETTVSEGKGYSAHTPGYSFYLKVGETREVTVTMKNYTTLVEEMKTVSWEAISGKTNIELSFTNVNKAKKTCTVKGLKPGVSKIRAYQDYNHENDFGFTINVIDFDASSMYLWEYNKQDREQFGYSSDNKPGDASGTATLNGLDWQFERDDPYNINSLYDAMAFGTNDETEENVLLTNVNNRKVKKIHIEAASQDEQTNLVIKVGETEIFNNNLGKVSYNILPSYVSSASETGYQGNITLKFTTPDCLIYGVKEGYYYSGPGAFRIRSIWIEYIN